MFANEMDLARSILGLCDISIISFIAIFSLMLFIAIFSLISRYNVFPFLITIIATDIAKGYR